MVKRHTYTVSTVGGRMVLTYEVQGVTHRVEHRLPGQPTAAAQERNFYRNMPRKERYKAIAKMMQPLLRPHGD
jgi:hypothetical protein